MSKINSLGTTGKLIIFTEEKLEIITEEGNEKHGNNSILGEINECVSKADSIKENCYPLKPIKGIKFLINDVIKKLFLR